MFSICKKQNNSSLIGRQSGNRLEMHGVTQQNLFSSFPVVFFQHIIEAVLSYSAQRHKCCCQWTSLKHSALGSLWHVTWHCCFSSRMWTYLHIKTFRFYFSSLGAWNDASGHLKEEVVILEVDLDLMDTIPSTFNPKVSFWVKLMKNKQNSRQKGPKAKAASVKIGLWRLGSTKFKNHLCTLTSLQ